MFACMNIYTFSCLYVLVHILCVDIDIAYIMDKALVTYDEIDYCPESMRMYDDETETPSIVQQNIADLWRHLSSSVSSRRNNHQTRGPHICADVLVSSSESRNSLADVTNSSMLSFPS